MSAGTRVYYIDACLDHNGGHYLQIAEIPTVGGKKRQRMIIYAEKVREFVDALLDVVEKA